MSYLEKTGINTLESRVSKIVRELYQEDYKPGLKHISVAAREWWVCIEIKMKIQKYGAGFLSDERIFRHEVRESCKFYDLKNCVLKILKKYPDYERKEEMLRAMEEFEAARLGRAPKA